MPALKALRQAHEQKQIFEEGLVSNLFTPTRTIESVHSVVRMRTTIIASWPHISHPMCTGRTSTCSVDLVSNLLTTTRNENVESPSLGALANANRIESVHSVVRLKTTLIAWWPHLKLYEL